MMQSGQQLSELQAKIYDIFVEVDSEAQEAQKKAASQRYLQARRAIEDHFDKKKLQQELLDYDFT